MNLPRNIVKRGSVYYFRLTVDGQSIRRSLGTDLREAKRMAKQLAKDVARGTLLVKKAAPVELTFSQFNTKWLAEYVKQRRSPHNHGLTTQQMDDYVLPHLGSMKLSKVSYSDLRKLRATLDETKLSAQSKKHILGNVRCLFRYALDCDELEKSPWKPSLMPVMKESAPKRLSDKQVALILQNTPKKWELAVKLGLLTGMRWGEIHTLRWTDVVDLPQPHLVLENTKSGKVRRVPLPEEAVLLLQEERTRQKDRSVFVLRERTKAPGTFVQWIGHRAEFHWWFHQLRHTYACRWLEAGGSKESLQKILGHSTIRLTERYGQLSDKVIFSEAGSLQMVTNSGHRELE